MGSKRIARDASQQWIGADYSAALDFARTLWTHCGTNE
jgi:hypothetical protein